MRTIADRFTSRVADYVRYRPDYPAAAIEVLVRELDVRPGRTVLDAGAGTGILTLPLAHTGADVIALDPNEHMLDAARVRLDAFERVRIQPAKVEATGLDDASVDAVTAGQAFHWFDPVEAGRELRRIVRPGGKVALVWNQKRFDESGFLAGYERLLEAHAPDFARVRHEKTGEEQIRGLYGRVPDVFEFPHEQRFDVDGVIGRSMSSSYAPKAGTPGHDELVAGLRALFDAHARDGFVTWPYTTRLYVGALD